MMFDSRGSQPIYLAELKRGLASSSPSKLEHKKVASQSVDLDEKNNVEMTELIDLNPSDHDDDDEAPNVKPLGNQYTKGSCFKLLTDCLCWLRICLLIFIVLLLLLTVSYCMGQSNETKLHIITQCPQPKTREEIWQHSYDAFKTNGNAINDESQFGYTNEPCWTTRKIEINTDQLWYSNQYTTHSQNAVNIYSILFASIFIYLAVIITYNMVTFSIDIIAIKNNKMHTKSSFYANYTSAQTRSICCDALYTNYFHNDTTGWIMIKLVAEFAEFMVQSSALLLYNGYHVFDPNNQNDVYLANRPQFILIFASILAFNYIGSGFLWLLYASCPNCCFGKLFNRAIFFVDIVSDFCYALFPFYIAFMDDYNEISDIFYTPQINSQLLFVATFVPLLFLGNKCFVISITVRQEMQNKYFSKWKTRTENECSVAVQHFKSLGYSLNAAESIAANEKNKAKSWIYHDIKEKNEPSRIKIFNQIWVLCVSFFFIVFGSMVLILTLNHFQSSSEYCHSITEQKYFGNDALFESDLSLSDAERTVFSQNGELYLWDACLYKVYPFVNDDEFKCQCRIFVVDWNDLESKESERRRYFNLTQDMILKGALNHWYMLEKFHTFGDIDLDINADGFIFASSMYKSIHMKAFDWRDVDVWYLGDGISAWTELQYLAFVSTSFMQKLPSDFGGLESVQYLLFERNGLNALPDSICELSQLQVLQVQFETDIQALPHCVSKLTQLKAIWFDVTGLTQIPLSIFNLPNLLELSLFVASIDFYNLLDYNNISINDSMHLDVWFEDNFKFNNFTDYWLTSNPICQESELLPSKLQNFINETCLQLCPFSASHFCPPRLFGDGKCTKGCDTMQCGWDYGDCTQLCFSEQLSSCTYQKLVDNRCDDACNNDFCVAIDSQNHMLCS